MNEATSLLRLYVPLIIWIGSGWVLGRWLPNSIPLKLGKFLFWVGVPLSIVAFLRQANLSAAVWLAPFTAWAALLLGALLAWGWIQGQIYLARFFTSGDRLLDHPLQHRPTQGSFLLAAMVGNTGYLGYPVSLALVGTEHFGWAVFYDTMGSTLGAYGLGVMLAAHFSESQHSGQLWQSILKNPAFWSFWLGLGLRSVPLPGVVELGLKNCAWVIIALSLLLLGMRLSQLSSWHSVQPAAISLGIKMLIVPLLLGFELPRLGITGLPQLSIVLQMAMPPAFATLVIAEAYDLDRDLTVTTLALGSIGLLVLLPLWIWLFAP
ncbi:MAG TPA: AEC family transporter [Trichocoleus sp.]|jgi:predicted permease